MSHAISQRSTLVQRGFIPTRRPPSPRDPIGIPVSRIAPFASAVRRLLSSCRRRPRVRNWRASHYDVAILWPTKSGERHPSDDARIEDLASSSDVSAFGNVATWPRPMAMAARASSAVCTGGSLERSASDQSCPHFVTRGTPRYTRGGLLRRLTGKQRLDALFSREPETRVRRVLGRALRDRGRPRWQRGRDHEPDRSGATPRSTCAAGL